MSFEILTLNSLFILLAYMTNPATISDSQIFIYLQNIFGIISLPEDIYFTSYLPMVILLKDIIAILAISIGMVIVSIYISANRTIVLSPMKSIYLDK